jgi:pimeloyl-ACP methyl ester carboxylesterase
MPKKYFMFSENNIKNVFNKIKTLQKNEIEHMIINSICYNKLTFANILPKDININNISRTEIINLIKYSLFGLEINQITNDNNYKMINDICNIIETKLDLTFDDNSNDRYIYRKWGSNYINFNFRPLFLQIILKSIINIINYYLRFKIGFNYKNCSKTNISFLYKIDDPSKQTIFFIHGLGFCYIPYMLTLLQLEKKFNLIIIILPSISTYRYKHFKSFIFPELTDINDCIYDFLKNKKIEDCILLSHSFGTYITQILRKDPRISIFKKIIMIDPIIFWIGCFKMSVHVDNPLVRNGTFFRYMIDKFINYLIYQCIYLKYVCYRIMYGPDFWIIDINELSNTNITLILEKGDYVIPAEILYKNIKNVPNIKYHYIDDEEAVHGSIIIESKYVNQLIDIINE